MIVYISGQITGDKNFRRKFNRSATLLKKNGHTVINPAILPAGLLYESYMDIGMAMVRACGAILQLDDWHYSPGARAGDAYAKAIGKQIFSENSLGWF